MRHEMRLKDDPFFKIWEGKKTIELRLFDEKRRKVHVDDTIEFSRVPGGNEQIMVRVVKLHVFDSFQSLYENLPLDKCGYEQAAIANAKASDMDAYYSPEEQHCYGVVGIEFIVLEKRNAQTV